MRFSAAFVLSVLSFSVSSITAAPLSSETTDLNNLAARDLDATHPEAAFERRDYEDEEIHLAMRDLVETYHDLMQRDVNGELTEVERRWNWKKALGKAAKIGLKVATTALLKREEALDLEFAERDFVEGDIEELD